MTTTIGFEALLESTFERRRSAGLTLLDEAAALAAACHALAARFRAGGRLLAFGAGIAAADAQHIAVEFLHPVIVGKRALPAIALTSDAALLTGVAGNGGAEATFAGALQALGEPGDIALGVSLDGRDPSVARGLGAAHALGMLTLALSGGERTAPVPASAEHRIVVAGADPLAAREVLVTAYHVLWELVHVFLDRPAEIVA